ncbi:MAG: diacylglycerol kinase family protein [Bacteroidales bacterium]
MKKIAIIANSKYKKAVGLKERLKNHLPPEYNIFEKLTERQGHSTALTIEAVNEGAEIIIAAGGDGTLNEVVNGIMLSPEPLRNKVLLGLYPLGTGNDFARTALFKADLETLSKLVVNGKSRKIDLGCVEFSDGKNEKVIRYFDNIADIGIGARTVEIVNKSTKPLGSTLTFILSVLKAFTGYKQQKVRVKTADFEWIGKIVAVCMANGKYFGSGLGISPGASLDNGKLSLVIVGNISVVHFLRYLPALRKLKFINHPEVHYRQMNWCEITADEKYPLEMDGESVGFTPLKATVIPQALNLLTS